MKVVLVTLALVAAVFAAPATLEKESDAQIVRSEFNTQPEGAYDFGYETENGITRQETGEVREALDEENKPHTVVVVRGTFSYIDKDGKQQTISYYADETGFHAEGDSIPKQEAVARR